MSKHVVILVLTLFIAIFLRFFQLGQNPPSLTWDEVAWGYNAYSLGIDGRDEFGRFLPLDYLESFGDFKPPLYAYASIVPIKIFGMTEFGTRFASAFFGVLTVLITYFLVRRIFVNAEVIALLSAFFLAISPWHINLSRAAFEANVATFFIATGVWLFLEAIKDKKWMLLLSVSSFILSIYTFNTARVVSPLLLMLLTLVFWRILWRIRYQAVIAMLIGVVLMLPIANFLVSSQASLRFKEVNIFSNIGIINTTNQKIENDNNAFWSRIVNNRRILYSIEYLKHYFDHFKPKFLFISGDGNPKFSTQDVGQLYLWELPFFIGGILFLFRKHIGHWWIVPVWMLIGIVPAATARETPHALRIETTLPTFQILTAIGVVYVLTEISKIKYQIAKIPALPAGRHIKYLILTLFFLFLLFNFSYYIHGYYMHYSREYSGEWQYGYKDSIAFAQSVQDEFDEIHVTTELGRPYIYYLFYMGLDPQEFRKDADIAREVYGFVHVERFGKYFFKKELKRQENSQKKILYIDTERKAPDNVEVLRKFYLLNGEPVLTAYIL